MKIRFGYELQFWSPSQTPMIMMVHAQPAADQRLLIADDLRVDPPVPFHLYRDGFGNICTRLELPGGPVRLTAMD